MREIFAGIFFTLLVGFANAQNVNGLIAQAEENLKRNHWEQAVDNFKAIIDNHFDDMTYHQRAKVFNNLGYLNYNLLDPLEAEKNLSLSLQYHNDAGIPNPKDYADALLNMGVLYLELVEFDQARQYIQQSLDILKDLPGDKSDYWIARSKLAFVYEEAGSHTLALSIYNESYDQLVASGNDLSPDFAEICMHKGRILIFTGDPVEGEKFIGLSTTIYESLGPDYAVQRAESLEHLAIFYEKMGRFNEAEETLLAVLKLKRSIPDEADILIIETLNDLGVMYHQLGQYEKSRAMFNEVVVECEENVGTDHPFYATAKNNLGSLAIADGNFEEARDMFQAALKTFKTRFGETHPYYANALNNLARVERKLGNSKLAENYYLEVLKIDERIYGKYHPNYATTLVNLGILCSSTNREEDAAKYYEEAVTIRERVLGINHPAYGSALEYMGMHSLAVEDFENAEVYFKKSIKIQIDRIHTLFPIMSEPERQGFYNSIKSSIDRYNFIAFRLLEKNPDLIKDIYDFHVKTKSILFSTSDKVLETVSESEDYELKSMFRQWQSDKKLLASYYQMGIHELEELNVDLTYEESRIERQENNLIKRIDNFEGSLQRVREDWKAVQSQVDANEAIVEVIRIREFESIGQGSLYSFTNFSKYLAVIFKPGESGPSFKVLGSDATSDSHYLKLYNDYLSEGNDASSVYERLWKPIHDEVSGVEFVRYGADGAYRAFNPNTFQTATGKYVIDDYLVTVLSSPKDLFKKDQMIFNKKAYMFHDPIFSPNDESDPMHISELVISSSGISEDLFDPAEWKVRMYEERDANEHWVRAAFNPTVVHFDSYGFAGDKLNYIRAHSPLGGSLFESGIYLTGASDSYSKFSKKIRTIAENDGLLTTYEVMNLNLTRTKLVVLSAFANLKDSEQANGLYGVQRAFMVAGAANLIIGLSEMDGAINKAFFDLFYSKYIETNQVGKSLKYAQLELRKQHANPKVWGSYILTGTE